MSKTSASPAEKKQTHGVSMSLTDASTFVRPGIDSASGPDHRIVKLRLQHRAFRQRGQILSDANLAFVELQQFDLLLVLLAAKYQSDRGVLVFPSALMFVEPAKVKLHLAFVSRLEAAQFQFDRH
jgi:hypothetical protein